MSISRIAAGWRARADDMDRNAKSYSRSCVKAKAAQLIIGAKLLRSCATEIEAHEAEQAGTTSSQAGPEAEHGQAVAEGTTGPQA